MVHVLYEFLLQNSRIKQSIDLQNEPVKFRNEQNGTLV